jgi:uncharacterized protein
MTQQVLVIHGGDIFGTYDEYVASLKSFVIDSLEYFTKHRWKQSLQDKLGSGYAVISPNMPNKSNAKYEEWKIWFEKLLPLCNDGVIVIGHSLGGVFLAKYLSENTITKKIRATIMIATPYDEDDGKKMPEFSIMGSLTKFQEQGGTIIIYHSKDDPVVQFSELQKYENALPNAHMRVFEDRQHFNQEEFPELVEEIRRLA